MSWLRLGRLERKIHDGLFARFPRFMRVSGFLIHGSYSFFISPAFAVILALVLVGFVISGVVSLIVSLSMFAAWLITTLAFAKSSYIIKLPIIRRVTCVFVFALATGAGAHAYVKWCINKAIEKESGNPPKTVTAPARPIDLDSVAYERLRNLFDQEIKGYEASRPVPRIVVQQHVQAPNDQPKANPEMELLANAQKMQFNLCNFQREWELQYYADLNTAAYGMPPGKRDLEYEKW
jgi:hypothetical protein